MGGAPARGCPGGWWADLAVASWSLTWNFEGDWQRVFFDAYGIDPDRERIDYYRLLWEMSP